MFTINRHCIGRRQFEGESALVQMAVVGSKLLVTAKDEDARHFCEATYRTANAAWAFDFRSLRPLETYLLARGQRIAQAHPFFLPAPNFKQEESGNFPFSVRWYEEPDLAQFCGDSRFDEALGFHASAPDLLAVTAEQGGQILGMAGASRDSQKMWQIGINVLPCAEGRHIGEQLVHLLAQEVLRRGAVPFYGTSQSHIASQRVALAAGFLPAWGELFTEPVP